MNDQLPALPVEIAAQHAADVGALTGLTANPTSFGLVLALLALMAIVPFLLTLVTSFAKFVIVLGIVRQALGTQHVPPTMVVTGLALILTVHVMWPTAERAWEIYQSLPAESEASTSSSPPNPISLELARRGASALQPAMREFLLRHSTEANVELFRSMRSDLSNRPARSAVTLDVEGGAVSAPAQLDLLAAISERSKLAGAVVEDLTIHAPAFVLTELTEAFQIGFLIFIPFLVIDLVTSNILMSMGMQMLTPQNIALPLKLLLFVLVDGWRLLLTGLVGGYA